MSDVDIAVPLLPFVIPRRSPWDIVLASSVRPSVHSVRPPIRPSVHTFILSGTISGVGSKGHFFFSKSGHVAYQKVEEV